MEYNRYELALLVELDLFNEVRDIYFDTRIKANVREENIKSAITQFFKVNKVNDVQDQDFVFDKIEKMIKTEKELRARRKQSDFGDGTR